MNKPISFITEHRQVFATGLKKQGAFTRSQLGKLDEDVKQLDYSIEYEYEPARGKRKAQIRIKLTAFVIDIQRGVS